MGARCKRRSFQAHGVLDYDKNQLHSIGTRFLILAKDPGGQFRHWVAYSTKF